MLDCISFLKRLLSDGTAPKLDEPVDIEGKRRRQSNTRKGEGVQLLAMRSRFQILALGNSQLQPFHVLRLQLLKEVLELTTVKNADGLQTRYTIMPVPDE